MHGNNPTAVTLDVRNFATNGDGWTNVVASNGETYSYKYINGNQPANNGSVAFRVGHGNAAVTVRFARTTDARYRIQDITFVNDHEKDQQLSTHGNAARTRVIDDRCTEEIDAQYKVAVLDTTANAVIPCDPAIKNQPQ